MEMQSACLDELRYLTSLLYSLEGIVFFNHLYVLKSQHFSTASTSYRVSENASVSGTIVA